MVLGNHNPPMKYPKIIAIIFAAVAVLPVNAQNSKTMDAHRAAHHQQLANVKSRMDKSVIKDFIKNDVDRREAEAIEHNPLSSESSAMINDLLKEARSHMGKRYRSGAKGPNAFDCSGFSSYVYRQFGYDISTSSKAQYADGESVDRKDLRAGDLVFFTGRSLRRGIGHVGIVVSADNEKGTFKFIHASTSQGIRIDTNDGYYAKRYVGARRIITK